MSSLDEQAAALPKDDGGMDVDELLIPFLVAHLQCTGLPPLPPGQSDRSPEALRAFACEEIVASAQALVDALIKHAEAHDA